MALVPGCPTDRGAAGAGRDHKPTWGGSESSLTAACGPPCTVAELRPGPMTVVAPSYHGSRDDEGHPKLGRRSDLVENADHTSLLAAFDSKRDSYSGRVLPGGVDSMRQDRVVIRNVAWITEASRFFHRATIQLDCSAWDHSLRKRTVLADNCRRWVYLHRISFSALCTYDSPFWCDC